jgi:hypothetical protein
MTKTLDPELIDLQPEPYVCSIEPVSGRVFQHALAKWFAKELWHRHNANGGVYTVALLQNKRIVDTYDGRDWNRENPWWHDHPTAYAAHKENIDG